MTEHDDWVRELRASGEGPPLPEAALAKTRETFTRWLGEEYDFDALCLVLAAAAVDRLDGDPLWALVVSGSGNAKTETVQALAGAGALVTSTITSEGALLSATPKKETAADATGGLLRKIGDHGVMVIKDVTSILSMPRETRSAVLGALREVYDGRWSRNVGTDGGRTLDWSGRLALVGAVTTAWDTHHGVVAAMGDRFVLLRMDSSVGRQIAGRRAIGNTGHEEQMRRELAESVRVTLDAMQPVDPLSEDETARLLAAADLVTLARTAVETDQRGEVLWGHAPEMPTRFAKQLAQVVRGGVAVGMDRDDALRLAIRCARDSVPPLRLAVIDDVAANPGMCSTAQVRKRIGKPRVTVDRTLQALHMLGVVECDEEEIEWAGKPGTRWYYRLAEGIDPSALEAKSVPDTSVPTPSPKKEGGQSEGARRTPSDVSGTDPRCRTCGDALDGAARSTCASTCTSCEIKEMSA